MPSETFYDIQDAVRAMQAGSPTGPTYFRVLLAERADFKRPDAERTLLEIEDALREQPSKIQVEVLRAIGEHYDWGLLRNAPPEAVAELANRFMGSPDAAVRAAAVRLWSAAGFVEPKAEKVLAQIVRHDAALDARVAAAEALGGVSPGGPGARALHEVLAAGCPPPLHSRALLSLALIPDAEAGPAALRSLGHGDPDVRRAAAQALFDLRPATGSKGLPPETYGSLLQAMLRESDRGVRERLVAALDRVVRNPEGMAALGTVGSPEVTR